MTIKFTYMWGPWEQYLAQCREDCRDETDRSIWDLFAADASDTRCIQMGKTLGERG